MNVVTVIQARTGSTRFPGKALAELGGKPLIWHVIHRARLIGPKVCLAIPAGDAMLKVVARNMFVQCVEGSPDDVLGRYVQAASVMDADHVVRVTGDCPFLDVEAAKWTIAWHLQTGADFTHHVAEGRGLEVFTRQALVDSAERAQGVWFREHPDEWILHNQVCYHVERIKFSVDTPEDLEVAKGRI